MDNREYEQLILHFVEQLSIQRDDGLRERVFAKSASDDPEQSPREQMLALLDALRHELASRDRTTCKRVVAGFNDFGSSDRPGAVDDIVVSIGERDERLIQTRSFSLETALEDIGHAVAMLDALRMAIAEEPNPR